MPKIYTKTGDQGESGLIGGKRVPKDHLRLRVYGALDELNSTLGMVLAEKKIAKPLEKELLQIQSDLFSLGSELATPREQTTSAPLIGEKEITELEKSIDSMETKLPKLKNFILPGGSKGGATLHLARTLCRRSERELIGLHRGEPVRIEVIMYINRLSDYLFVAARFQNRADRVKETIWKIR